MSATSVSHAQTVLGFVLCCLFKISKTSFARLTLSTTVIFKVLGCSGIIVSASSWTAFSFNVGLITSTIGGGYLLILLSYSTWVECFEDEVEICLTPVALRKSWRKRQFSPVEEGSRRSAGHDDRNRRDGFSAATDASISSSADAIWIGEWMAPTYAIIDDLAGCAIFMGSNSSWCGLRYP